MELQTRGMRRLVVAVKCVCLFVVWFFEGRPRDNKRIRKSTAVILTRCLIVPSKWIMISELGSGHKSELSTWADSFLVCQQALY